LQEIPLPVRQLFHTAWRFRFYRNENPAPAHNKINRLRAEARSHGHKDKSVNVFQKSFNVGLCDPFGRHEGVSLYGQKVAAQ
jgi:hypothetical protein